MNIKFHKITSLYEIYRDLPVFSQFFFLGLPWEIFFGVVTDDYLHL